MIVIILALAMLASLAGIVFCGIALRNRAEYRKRISSIRAEMEEVGYEARELWKDGCPSFYRAYARVEAMNAERLFLEDLLRSSWF